MAKERYVFELPEKVYIDDFGSGFSHGWHTEHSYENDIEYVRKDVFIEKICAFLNDRIEHDSIDYPMATKHLIEDFRNYAKEV